MNINFNSGVRYLTASGAALNIISDLNNLSDEDAYLCHITFKDFKKIFNINFEKRFDKWFKSFVETHSIMGDVPVHYKYDKSFSLIHDSLPKVQLYNLVKYYHFVVNNVRSYRVPMGVLKNNDTYILHPGNARLACMQFWEDTDTIKILITDNGCSVFEELLKCSFETYNMRKDAPEKIAKFLNLDTWERVFLRYTEDCGYELGEQHTTLRDFYVEYDLTYNVTDVVINGHKIIYLDSEHNMWKLSKPL